MPPGKLTLLVGILVFLRCASVRRFRILHRVYRVIYHKSLASCNIAIFVFVVALLRQKRLKAADFWFAMRQRKLKML